MLLYFFKYILQYLVLPIKGKKEYICVNLDKPCLNTSLNIPLFYSDNGIYPLFSAISDYFDKSLVCESKNKKPIHFWNINEPKFTKSGKEVLYFNTYETFTLPQIINEIEKGYALSVKINKPFFFDPDFNNKIKQNSLWRIILNKLGGEYKEFSKYFYSL